MEPTSDFLLFIQYCKTIPSPAKGFSRAFRKAISKWYFSKSSAQLTEMLGKNRSIYGCSHKDILTLAHVRFPDPERYELKKLIFKKGTDGIRYIESKQNPPAVAAPQAAAVEIAPAGAAAVEVALVGAAEVEVAPAGAPPAADSPVAVEIERRQRRQRQRQRRNQRQRQQERITLPESVLRMKELLSFKVCESASDGAQIIKDQNLAFENIPAHLLHYGEIWNAILPKLTYTDILNSLSTMSNLNVLKETDAFAKNLTTKLGSMKLVAQSKLYPLFIYITKIAYERNKPYVEHIKVGKNCF